MSGRWRGTVVLSAHALVAAASAVFLLLVLTGVAASASGRDVPPHATASFRPAPFQGFPLWKDAPGWTHATLREGNFRGTLWGAYASRIGKKPGIELRPCITVGKITNGGVYGNVADCGYLPEHASNGQEPLLALIGSASYGPNWGIRYAIYVGVGVSPDVSRVEIVLDPGGVVTKRTRLLSPLQGRDSRLAKFRYVAFAKADDACIKRLTGYDVLGVRLFNEPDALC